MEVKDSAKDGANKISTKQKLAALQRNNRTLQASHMKTTASTKFNRLLINLERSIMSKFGSSINDCGAGSCDKPATEMDESNVMLTARVRASTSGEQVDVTQNKVQKGSNRHLNDKTKITASLSSNSNCSGTQISSNPTDESNFNKYSHQFASTQLPNQSILPNRLSIPPPHANEEARSKNYNLLFGTGEAQYLQTTAIETGSAASVSCLDGDSKQFNDLLSVDSSSRPRPSPASSAKSLPTTALKSSPKLTSPPTLNESSDDSGFNTYKSSKFDDVATTQKNNTDMMLPSEKLMNSGTLPMQRNNFGCLSMSQFWAQRQVPNNNHQNFIFPNYQQQQSYPHTPNIQSNYSFNNDINIINENLARQGHFAQVSSLDDKSSTDTIRLARVPYLTQAQPAQTCFTRDQNSYNMINVQNYVPFESSQQIYANAPPKPRRYQYYDSSQNSMLIRMTQPHQFIAQYNGQPTFVNHNQLLQPSFNNGNQGNPMIMQQSQSLNQAPLNSGRYVNNQFQYVNVIADPTRTFCQPRNYFDMNHVIPNHLRQPYFNQYTQDIPCQTQMMKSKSSLDASDLSRFKQNRQQPNYLAGQNFENQQNHRKSIEPLKSIGWTMSQTIKRPVNNSPQLINNLHRSKSVTHLLPEGGPNSTNYQWFENLQQMQNLARSAGKIVNFPSASKTDLNLTGRPNNDVPQDNLTIKHNGRSNLGHNSQMIHSFNYSHDLMHKPKHQADTPLSQYHRFFNQQPKAHQSSYQSQNIPPVVSNLSASVMQQAHIKPQASFEYNSKSVRYCANDQESVKAAEPSLDDKIRSLMIGDEDRHQNTAAQQVHDDSIRTETSMFENDSTTISKSCFYKDQSSIGTAIDSKSNEQQTDAIQLSETQNLIPRFSSIQISDVSPDRKLDALSSVVSGASENHRDASLVTKGFGDSMGNQRSYFFQKLSSVGTGTESNQPNNAPNSQLIVDLTTPRVLAKTQTTLTVDLNQAKDLTSRGFCSINQTGLPAYGSGTETSINSLQNRNQVRGSTVDLSPMINNLDSIDSSEKNSSCVRTAPYYYSDLKSEAQKQALLTLAQQKSLSPPPALLSRSIDFSNTRLTSFAART